MIYAATKTQVRRPNETVMTSDIISRLQNLKMTIERITIFGGLLGTKGRTAGQME